MQENLKKILFVGIIMINSLVFWGLIAGLIALSYYINYYKFGELLSLYPKNSIIFLLRDHRNKVNQVKILVSLTLINNGLKRIEITDISLNLNADKVQIPFILATKSEFLSGEEISRHFPVSIKKGERYDSILAFTMRENYPRDKIKPLIMTIDDIETLTSGKYVINLTVKYGTKKRRMTLLKMNLDESTIANIPEIVENKVIFPMQIFWSLLESNNRKIIAPRKLYRW